MGVCYSQNDHIIRQRRLTKKTVYKYSENKILNNTTDEKATKKYDDFKISCDNFYNINNNFNYSIIDNSSKNNQNQNNNNNNNNNDESIVGLNLMNQPIENLTKDNPNNNINININSPDYDNQISKNEKYQKLLSYFNVYINQFPYNSLSQNQIISYEIEYTSSKLITPYKFIETKNNSLLFNKIYELCFLKCEPLLNNINDDKKKINLLFLRTVIILLNENNLNKTVSEVSNSLIELSYENNDNRLNINEFYQKIKCYCEICYQILFYFIIACSQFTEEQYYEYLNNENMLIQDKYSNIDIDIFCLNMIFENSKGNSELYEITSQWSDFICGKIEEDNFNNSEINIPLIKNKIIYMVNPYHLLQILSGIKLPKS